ncbi:MAG: type II toxin-antitoxin system VapC family toxin [Thermomicrobia bacterium]|nr:type II toxin-antitoxin system VapC family toxin [Thermomicrobia bacterium]
MPYLLDTNVVIRHLNGDPDTCALVRKLTPDGIAVSTVTQMEAWEGVYRASDPQALEAGYQEFFNSILVIPFDSAIARRGARLRYDLRRHSTRKRERALDLQIAATALHHGLELVTYNDQDYDDIAGLALYQK